MVYNKAHGTKYQMGYQRKPAAGSNLMINNMECYPSGVDII